MNSHRRFVKRGSEAVVSSPHDPTSRRLNPSRDGAKRSEIDVLQLKSPKKNNQKSKQARFRGQDLGAWYCSLGSSWILVDPSPMNQVFAMARWV